MDSEERRDALIARLAGKAGLRGKIDAKCVECVYDPTAGDGNWRQQVEACCGYSCPLYGVRAKSKPGK